MSESVNPRRSPREKPQVLAEPEGSRLLSHEWFQLLAVVDFKLSHNAGLQNALFSRAKRNYFAIKTGLITYLSLLHSKSL